MRGEDLSVFFDEFASRVSALGRTEEVGGILDAPQEYIGPDGDVMITDYELYVRTDQFGGLRMGDVVDVDDDFGQTIRFRCRRDARKRNDGAMSIVGLQRLGNVLIEADDILSADSTGAPDTTP